MPIRISTGLFFLSLSLSPSRILFLLLFLSITIAPSCLHHLLPFSLSQLSYPVSASVFPPAFLFRPAFPPFSRCPVLRPFLATPPLSRHPPLPLATSSPRSASPASTAQATRAVSARRRSAEAARRTARRCLHRKAAALITRLVASPRPTANGGHAARGAEADGARPRLPPPQPECVPAPLSVRCKRSSPALARSRPSLTLSPVPPTFLRRPPQGHRGHRRRQDAENRRWVFLASPSLHSSPPSSARLLSSSPHAARPCCPATFPPPWPCPAGS